MNSFVNSSHPRVQLNLALASLALALISSAVSVRAADAVTNEAKSASITGGVSHGKARLVIEADLTGLPADRQKLIFATALRHSVRASLEKLSHSFLLHVEILQGEPKELPLALSGDGEVRQVTGDGLQDWSVRQEADGVRLLVLRPKKSDKPVTNLVVTVTAETEWKDLPKSVTPLALASTQPALFNGYVRVDADAALDVQVDNPTGLVPVELKFMPDDLKTPAAENQPEPLAFRFGGSAYTLPLKLTAADPETRQVVLRHCRLTGQFSNDTAAFTLTAVARVKNPKGGTLDLLSGGVALTEFDPNPDWRLKFENGRFLLVTDKPGAFPLRLKFNATVRLGDGWNGVEFRVAPSALQPIVLQGLAADTQFQFAGAAKPERAGADFTSFLPPNGAVKLAWKEAKREVEGKLFYAAELLSQVAVSPGVMFQLALLEGKVMQGELTRVTLRVRGEGEVVRVLGTNLLAWNVESVPNEPERRLVVQFNQPQKDAFALQVQLQTALGAFPQAFAVMQLRPEGATRSAGYVRIVNDGAVRLEVLQSTGMSQVSPEQFPESAATPKLAVGQSSQKFAFRFSGADYQLRVQADNVLPEISVSEVLAYHLGETELAIDGEIELDVREAPVREVLLRVPKGFAIARLNASGLSDYFTREEENQPDGELRLVYGKPVAGRQVIQLRLERNKPLAEAAWALPRVEVQKAKSVRGHVGASADPGFRLTPLATENLTEVANAFFPKKVAGIQAAFRLSEAAWLATMKVERLPQSIQADAMHLFSIGEGIAYGSSVLNYLISGAPVSTFRLALSNEYFNVEFTGRDVRSWKTNAAGYEVQLHTPVSGPYTLLATYERPFKAQGDRLGFTGARPLDAQSEQGHTLVVSTYQFQVKPAQVSPSLLPLETAEVPAEYRLFFDAPILAAYRYSARPFDLQLDLSPLAQGETLGQVVDRAALVTRISKDGEMLTDAHYFVKNRGTPHFRVALPDGVQFLAATVNGARAVPVKDAQGNLIPLPQRADPNALTQIDLKLASRSKDPKRVRVAAPVVAVPVMLAEWKVEPDANQRLAFRSGTLVPVGGLVDVSGFAGLARMFSANAGEAVVKLIAALALVGIAAWAWRWAAREGYKFGARHLSGALLGLVALALAMGVFVTLGSMAEHQNRFAPRNLTFLAPVQQSGSVLNVDVANLPDKTTVLGYGWQAWPALLALFIWMYAAFTSRTWFRPVGLVLGWTLLAWAALRCPNGAPWFFGVLGAFLAVHVLAPSLRRLWQLPRKPTPTPPPPTEGTAAPAAALLLLGGLLGLQTAAIAQPTSAVRLKEPPLAESVTQEIRVQEKFVFATAKLRWHALKDQQLPLLFEPGVLTRVVYPTNALRLVLTSAGAKRAQSLLVQQAGTFDIELQYQAHVTERDGQSGFVLPTQYGLVNRLALTLVDLDVDVASAQAASVQREPSTGTNTVANLVLSPVNEAWIGWKPRSRDVKREKAVFYAELFQLYVPAAGVIEGGHQAQIRPAQGELSELIFDVPAGATITDVLDAGASAAKDAKARASIMSLWRFDPDTRKLRVSLNPPQSRPFALFIKSQVAAGPLPFEQTVGLISVSGAASQIGLLGVATGPEVQLDSVSSEPLSSINLEDFPAAPVQTMQAAVSGLTLRRAFRYADTQGMAKIKAAAVEPDVRVTTQDTLSLGEDRTVLAANVGVEITRAGIFRLSFVLPTGLDVESISGQAMTHWTELKTDAGRVITLHLRGKTEGQQQFSINLTGPGVKATKGWAVPRLLLREASKQSGQLVIVPEQGMRLQVATRDNATQLDPQKSGIRQKGVLAFRLLTGQWALSLEIEQVDPWIQVTSLQHVTVSEAQVKVAANLQYQIENTGLKSFRVRLPANADSVRFRGEQMADFLAREGAPADGLREWEVKLHRRVIGKYLLQVTYQLPLAEQAKEAAIAGVRAEGVNVQRGYLTLQSAGRLQVGVKTLPAALQPTEWQGIPRELRKDIQETAANFTFRLVEAGYQLAAQIERHEAAKLLPARVNNVTLSSVISDDGVMLTQARLEMIPGDKRLLHLKLPKEARFWFAFVNQNGVWPWREGEQVLIPLEQSSRTGQAIVVELFYSSQVGKAGSRALDLQLLGPQFDLPLENITWRVYLNEKWQLADWTGTLQLQQEEVAARPAALDLQTYLQNEATVQRQKTKDAEQLLELGNTMLQKGDPQQARRAFQSAYGLSTHDDAFNEDARVQLHNLKLQQALIGLNVRQSAAGGEAVPAAGKLTELRERKSAAYTQDEAKQIIDRNPAEENAAFMRLAERLIQQQDAAVASPTAIRATIPEQGRLLTFTRAMQVDTWTDLKIGLEAKAAKAASAGVKFFMLLGVLVVLSLFATAARREA